jgi:FkbM family methyltransferase
MKLIKNLAIFFFDILDSYHQKKILGFIKNKYKNINFFIDIGSHKGKYFDLFNKSYKIKTAVLVEPQKKYFYYLKKKYKKLYSIKIYNTAISNKNGNSYFYINHHDLTSSLNRINHNNLFLKIKSKLFGLDSKSMIKEKIKIKINTLNNLLRKFKVKKIDLVKIDTEGHELEVLQGLKNTVKRVQIILIEFRSDNVYKNYKPSKIHKNLVKNNFYLAKVFKFPFTTWEDRIYIKKIL